MKERVGLGTQVAFTVLGRRNTWAGLAQRLAEGVCCRCELRGRTEEEKEKRRGKKMDVGSK